MVGAGGIGTALLNQLVTWAPSLALIGTRRAPAEVAAVHGAILEPWSTLPLDLSADASLEALAARLAEGPPFAW